MFSWGGGGRQCLVLRGTRVPPSCKWEGTETGILLAQTGTVSYTHLRAHETVLDLVCRLLLEKKHPVLIVLFIVQNITNHHPTVDTYWSWEGPPCSTLFWSF